MDILPFYKTTRPLHFVFEYPLKYSFHNTNQYLKGNKEVIVIPNLPGTVIYQKYKHDCGHPLFFRLSNPRKPFHLQESPALYLPFNLQVKIDKCALGRVTVSAIKFIFLSPELFSFEDTNRELGQIPLDLFIDFKNELDFVKW